MSSASAYRWKQVRDEVLTRIQKRDWAPGAQIPHEEDLAEEFGCARATVNRALQNLADDGFIERRRRAGTRVAAVPVRHARLAIPIVREEIEQSGKSYGYSLISRADKPVTGLARLQLGLSEGERAIAVHALHLADGQPQIFEERWINPAAVPEARNAPFTEISANEWLVRNAPFSSGTLSFSAAAAGPSQAEFLQTALAAPLFVVERTTSTAEIKVTWVRMSYRPGHSILFDL